MKYVIKAGCEKLTKIRKINSDAGGLIVASSVVHAYQLLNIVEKDFCQSATIVTYHDNDALSKISHFREGETEWIISVGMISEGTDIPRLQVCCHLSTIKTELYFRQVLGRILRVSQKDNQDAWLFTLATDELTLYSERLVNDVPEGYQVVHEIPVEKISSIDYTSSTSVGSNLERDIQTPKHLELEMNFFEEESSSLLTSNKSYQLRVGAMYQRVIDAFIFPHS